MSGSDFKLTESTRAVFTCERGTVEFYFIDADKYVEMSEGPRTSPPRFGPITKHEPIRIEKRRLYERN